MKKLSLILILSIGLVNPTFSSIRKKLGRRQESINKRSRLQIEPQIDSQKKLAIFNLDNGWNSPIEKDPIFVTLNITISQASTPIFINKKLLESIIQMNIESQKTIPTLNKKNLLKKLIQSILSLEEERTLTQRAISIPSESYKTSKKVLNIISSFEEYLYYFHALLTSDIFNPEIWMVFALENSNQYLLIPTEFASEYENSFNNENLIKIDFNQDLKEIKKEIRSHRKRKGSFSKNIILGIQSLFKNNTDKSSQWNILALGHGLATTSDRQISCNFKGNKYDFRKHQFPTKLYLPNDEKGGYLNPKSGIGKSQRGRIIDLEIDDFRELLLFLNNEIRTRTFVYEACYSSGFHATIPYLDLNLNYDVIINNFGNMPSLATLKSKIIEIKKYIIKKPYNILNFKKLISNLYNTKEFFLKLEMSNYKLAILALRQTPTNDNELYKNVGLTPIIKRAYQDSFNVLNIYTEFGFKILQNLQLRNSQDITNGKVLYINQKLYMNKIKINVTEKQKAPIFAPTTQLMSTYSFKDIEINTTLKKFITESFLSHPKKSYHTYLEIPYSYMFKIYNLNTLDKANLTVYVFVNADTNTTEILILDKNQNTIDEFIDEDGIESSSLNFENIDIAKHEEAINYYEDQKNKIEELETEYKLSIINTFRIQLRNETSKNQVKSKRRIFRGQLISISSNPSLRR